jgi:hypothetical protein
MGDQNNINYTVTLEGEGALTTLQSIKSEAANTGTGIKTGFNEGSDALTKHTGLMDKMKGVYQEHRGEMRMQNFMFREMQNAVGGVALGVMLLEGGIGGSNKEMKKMLEPVKDGLVAFQALSVTLSAFGPAGQVTAGVVAGGIAIGGVIKSLNEVTNDYTESNKKAAESVKNMMAGLDKPELERELKLDQALLDIKEKKVVAAKEEVTTLEKNQQTAMRNAGALALVTGAKLEKGIKLAKEKLGWAQSDSDATKRFVDNAKDQIEAMNQTEIVQKRTSGGTVEAKKREETETNRVNKAIYSLEKDTRLAINKLYDDDVQYSDKTESEKLALKKKATSDRLYEDEKETLSSEKNTKVREAIVTKYYNLILASDAEFNKQIQAVDKKTAEGLIKSRESVTKSAIQLEKEDALFFAKTTQDKLAVELEFRKKEIDAAADAEIKILQLTAGNEDKIKDINAKAATDKASVTSKTNKEVDADNNKLTDMTITDASAALTTIFGNSKAAAEAQAIINTYQGATKALAELPPPFNFIEAGLVIASGLANVAKITEQNFATGTSGFVVPSGYNNDNYRIGLSSGEKVKVTPKGKSDASSSGVTLNVHFNGAVTTEDGIKLAVEQLMKKLGTTSVSDVFKNQTNRISL